MKHYVVGYHDKMNNIIEICEYAKDAYQAIQQAKEDIPELIGHPNACEYCYLEDGRNKNYHTTYSVA